MNLPVLLQGGTGGKGGTGSKTEASDRAQNVYGGVALLTWILSAHAYFLCGCDASNISIEMLPSFFGYAAQWNSGGPWLFGTPAYILCTDLISKRRITGGIGGKGGEGSHRGGEGGLGEASKIWVGSTPQFSKIFGKVFDANCKSLLMIWSRGHRWSRWFWWFIRRQGWDRSGFHLFRVACGRR
jgi:hypothetical protein